MTLGTAPSVDVGMLIRRPPADVFEALADPAVTTRFWYATSTGRMAEGAELTWAWVLQPGGWLAGADGLDTPARRELHEDDVFVPVDPGTLAARLRAAGFAEARVDVAGDRVRFAAATGR